MDILAQFKSYIFSPDSTLSVLTAKNYLSDVLKFASWYEGTYHKHFSASALQRDTVETYKKSLLESSRSDAAIRSVNRYLSSLRKLSAYLVSEGVLHTNPLSELTIREQSVDPLALDEFKRFLTNMQIAPLTTKNYLLDLKQFFSWLEEISPDGADLLPAVDALMLQEYRNRLLEAGVAPASINRKVSSLRKYTSWAMTKGIISNQDLSLSQVEIQKEEDTLRSLQAFAATLEGELPRAQDKQTNEPQGFFGGPKRTISRVSKAGGLLFDTLLVLPLFKLNEAKNYLAWIMTGKQIFTSIATNRVRAHLTKQQLIHPQLAMNRQQGIATDSIVSTQPLSWKKRMWYIMRHHRPKWYKTYHTYPIVHYVHFALLMLTMMLFSLVFYNHVSGKSSAQGALYANAEAPPAPRLLSFKGTLKDAQDFPITTPELVRFTLYNDKTASGTAVLWQEVQEVAPADNGSFATRLGLQSTLPNSVFTDNTKLYLGITIGSNTELSPRQQIASTSLATNAEKINGMLPITADEAGTKNVLLALDSSGNLEIGGNASPTFQASGGQLTLSGETLLLTTNEGSNSNVLISPDGTGQIDLQKPLINSSDYSSIPGIRGAVQVDDTLAVNANNNGQPALMINQSDAGALISASSSGQTRFSVLNDGSAFFTGNVGIGTTSPTTGLEVNGGLKVTGIGIGLEPTSAYALQTNGTIRAKISLAEQVRTFDTGDTNLIKLVVNAPASQSADLTQWQVGGSPVAVLKNNGFFGLGTMTPSQRLEVQGNAAIAGDILLLNESHMIAARDMHALTLGDNQTGDVLINPGGNVGVGTTTPHTKAQISGGSLCVGTDANCALVTQNTEGRLYAASISNSYFDVAENYPTKDMVLSSGDIAVLDPNTGVFVKKSTGAPGEIALGVISEKPGMTLGGFHGEQYQNERQVPVGLSGRVPVKVTTANGAIHIGDELTLSSIAGVAMKATNPGPVIGTALEQFTDSDPSHVGSIQFFIKTGWSDPSVMIAQNGDLNITTDHETYAITQNGNPIRTVIGAVRGTFANLTVGAILAKSIVTDSLVVKGQDLSSYITSLVQTAVKQISDSQLLSPIITTDILHTHVLSPVESDGSISLKLGKQTLSIINDHSGSGSAVTTFDNEGNATLSGTLQANTLQSNDASISGTLHAGRIIADEIVGLPQATSSATYVTNVTNIYSTQSSDSAQVSPITSTLASIDTNGFGDPASLSGSLSRTDVRANFITANQGLLSLGPTSLADTSVATQLSVGGTMILSENSVNTLGATFEIQPLRQGTVTFMGGLIAIDTSGNLTARGNATFLKDVQVAGNLSTGMLSPIPDKDLVIHLGNNNITDSALASASNQSLVITNASGSAIFKVDQGGNVQASGSGTFRDVIAKNFQVVRSVQADTSLTETVATASAGTATITAGQTERTIVSPYVKANSLIYITPLTNTRGNMPYVARQTADDQSSKGSFTISLPETSATDVKVNWWIVN